MRIASKASVAEEEHAEIDRRRASRALANLAHPSASSAQFAASAANSLSVSRTAEPWRRSSHQPLRSFTYYETQSSATSGAAAFRAQHGEQAPRAAASKDKLEVRYVGKGNHSHDVGAIRADRPCPQRRVLYYFEVTVLDAGLRGSIAVGLADSTLQLCRQPGWEPNSYGYHGADGRKYTDSERGESYGPAFTTGDVVGCGVLCLSRRQVFFTKNGRHLGDAFVGVGGVLYPTVGLHSPTGASQSTSAGRPSSSTARHSSHPSVRRASSKWQRSRCRTRRSTALVRAYLLHHTYEKTLDALDAATPVPPPPTARLPLPRRRRRGRAGRGRAGGGRRRRRDRGRCRRGGEGRGGGGGGRRRRRRGGGGDAREPRRAAIAA